MLPSNIVVKSSTAGNLKGVLRQSSIGKGVVGQGKGNKVGLSQFSGTGNGS